MGGHRDRAGLRAVPAARLHQCGLRRLGPPRGHRGAAAAGGPARGVGRRAGAGDRGLRLRDRAGQGAALAGHRLRPPVPHADRSASPTPRHRGAVEGHGGVRQGQRQGRGPRAGQRLALRRLLAPSRRRGHWYGRLPARRHIGRAVRRRRRRPEGSERLLPGAHPDRGRTEPAVAVRRQRRAASHLEGITHAGNTPPQACPEGACRLPGRTLRPPHTAGDGGHLRARARRGRCRLRPDPPVRQPAGRPAHPQRPGRLQRPVHRAVRRPAGGRQRQDHVVHGQPGRHPPRGLRHRRRQRAGRRGPEELEGAAGRRQRRGVQPPDQGQRRGPGGSRLLPRRQAAVAGPDRRLHPLHRERGRHRLRPHVRHDPGGRQQARAGGRGGVLGGRLHRVLGGQRPEPGGRDRRGDRGRRAELDRGHRPARAGAGRRQALRQQRGRAPGQGRRHHHQLVRHPGAGRPEDRRHHHRHGQRHRPGAPRRPRRRHRRRPAPHRPVRQEGRGVRHQHGDQQRVGDQHRQRQGRPDDLHAAVAGGVGRLRARRGDAHRRRAPPRHAGPGQRGRRLPLHQPAGAGELRRSAADGLLPGGDHDRRQAGGDLQHPRYRRPPPHHRRRARHPRHHVERAAVHAPRRQCDPRPDGQGLPAERLDQRLGQGGQGQEPRQAGAGPHAPGRPVDDQARLPDRQGEPHLRPGARRCAAGQRRRVAGRVRRQRHAQPARAGRAVRAVRQHVRHRHQLRRGPQLADAGGRPGVHRVLRR
ncbi:hypothetical protein SGPA1_21589 [Streptomyces misionensis JCM 4497]